MRDYEYWLSLESESIYHDIHSISSQIKFIGLFKWVQKRILLLSLIINMDWDSII
jgi:hypothetical protein